MPVILPDVLTDEWLYPGQSDKVALTSLLAPAKEYLLLGSPVSPRVNSTKWDDPECLEPAAGNGRGRSVHQTRGEQSESG